MRVVILKDYNNIAEYTAKFVCNRINNFVANPKNKGKLFVLGLPTGIPQKHPESYHSFMFKNFFQHIDINPKNVNILNGNVQNLQAECERFEEEILNSGGIHLFIGGLGQDGHIAFNEPGTSLNSRTHIQHLTQDTIQANSRFFDGKIENVPKKALTVGVGTIMNAKEVLIIVNGFHKAIALQKTIESGISHMWTASALQNHSNAIFVVDEDATLELKVKTVKYFREIFENNSNFFA